MMKKDAVAKALLLFVSLALIAICVICVVHHFNLKGLEVAAQIEKFGIYEPYGYVDYDRHTAIVWLGIIAIASEVFGVLFLGKWMLMMLE